MRLFLALALLAPLAATAQTWTRVASLPEGGTTSVHADASGIYTAGGVGGGQFVLHRSDDGAAWTELRRTDFGTGTFVFERVWVDPGSDGQTVFNFGSDGVQVSTDAGTTWTRGGLRGTFVNAITRLGDQYLAAVQAAEPGALYTSPDGLAWTLMDAAPTGNAFDVFVDGDVILVALLQSAQSFGLWRSADAGATWQQVLSGFGHQRIVQTPTGIIAGGSDSTRPWRRSADGGVTWDGETVPLQFEARAAAAEGDIVALLDAQVRVSTDGGATFTTLTSVGPTVSRVSCLSDVAVLGETVYGSASCFDGSTDQNGLWRLSLGSDTSAPDRPRAARALRVFPNPTAGSAQVLAPEAWAEVTVHDVTGRRVATLTTDAQGEAALPALSPGVYLVRARGASGEAEAARVVVAR